MHQAQFVMGVISGFLSAVDEVVTTAAGDRCLDIIRLTASTARSRARTLVSGLPLQYPGIRTVHRGLGPPFLN